MLMRPYMPRASIGARVMRNTVRKGQSKASQVMEPQALPRRHFTKTSVVLRTVAIFEMTKAAMFFTSIPKGRSRITFFGQRATPAIAICGCWL